MKRDRSNSHEGEVPSKPAQKRDPLEIAGIDLSHVTPAECVERYRKSGRLRKLNETIKLTEESATVSSTMLGSIIRQ